MPDDFSAWKLDEDVLPRERAELARRRTAAEFEPEECNERAIEKGTVGLALSGGGIRAGAFAVGVLQALYSRGLLRFCDYLSTVSGGSYAGAFLASLGHHPHSSLNWGRTEGTTSGGSPAARSPAARALATTAGESSHRVTLAPDGQRRQSAAVQRLIHGGTSLNRPLLFVNNWLPGFLLINIVAISSLVAIAALVAYFFRLMYRLDVGRVLSTLGFSDDLSRAFFPAAVVFGVWALYLITKAVVAYGRGTRVATPTAQRLTLALIVVTLICAVSLLGVGDFDTQMLLNYLGISISKEAMRSLQSFVQWGFYTLLVIGILPYLTPERLLRSGASDNAPWAERAIFKVATSVMFWGLPLLAFAVLARENLSYYNNWRDDRYRLTRSTISNWGGFWGAVEADHRTYDHDGIADPPSEPPATPEIKQLAEADRKLNALKGPSDKLWHHLENQFVEPMPVVPSDAASASSVASSSAPQPAGGSGSVRVNDLLLGISAADLYQREQDLRTPLPVRWVAAAASCLGMHENNAFDQIHTGQWEAACNRELAVAELNYLLLDPEFPQCFEEIVSKFRLEPDPAKWPTATAFAGQPADVVAAYQKALTARQSIEAMDAGYLDRLRELRLADAVYTYHLACHDDRHEHEPDWRHGQQQIRATLAYPDRLMSDAVASDQRRVAVLKQHVKDLEKAHYDLLTAYYGPAAIQPPEAVFASVVTDADQSTRLWIAGIALVVFLAAGILVDMNQTTMHGFYRDQLAAVWVVEPKPHERMPLAELASSSRGAPYLLVNCAMAFLRKSSDTDEPTEAYLLSRIACGSERFGFAPTGQFDGGQFTLADAMAVSGAAVTPVASRNLAVRSLLWLMNFRLGQWLPNPAIASLRQPPILYRRFWRRPQPVHLLLSQALLSERQQDFHFVSDGGLHENLGVETLLRRRARLIIAVDAGADPQGQFEDLVKLLLRMRVKHGITIRGLTEGLRLPLQELLPPAHPSPASGSPPAAASAPRPVPPHYVVGVIEYPDGSPGRFVYLRPGLNGDEDSELDRYCKSNPNFPNDATADQFYEPARFEAYRLLGEHIGSKVCQELFAGDAAANSFQALFEKIEGAPLGATGTLGAGLPPALATPPGGPPAGPPPGSPPSDNKSSGSKSSGNGAATVETAADHLPAGNGAMAAESPAIPISTPPPSPSSTEELLSQIAAIVDAMDMGSQDVPRAALAQLDEKFDQLEQLDPAAAIRLSRQIYRQIFQRTSEAASQPRSPEQASGDRTSQSPQ